MLPMKNLFSVAPTLLPLIVFLIFTEFAPVVDSALATQAGLLSLHVSAIDKECINVKICNSSEYFKVEKKSMTNFLLTYINVNF